MVYGSMLQWLLDRVLDLHALFLTTEKWFQSRIKDGEGVRFSDGDRIKDGEGVCSSDGDRIKDGKGSLMETGLKIERVLWWTQEGGSIAEGSFIFMGTKEVVCAWAAHRSSRCVYLSFTS